MSTTAGDGADRWRAGETDLRILDPDEPDFARLAGDIIPAAYPAIKIGAAERAAHLVRAAAVLRAEPDRRFAGAYRAGELVGGMQLFDFTMRVRGAEVFTGGLGAVAVDLAHKRRGIARDIVAGFLERYRQRGAALGALYAFRPSFYRALGFGYGTKIDRYRVAPGAFPDDGSRARVRKLDAADAPRALAAYERMQAQTNGLMRRSLATMRRLIEEAGHSTYADIDPDGSVHGYVIFSVVLGPAGTLNTNEIDIFELVYDAPSSLAALLSFLSAQRDQFAAVTIATQDPDFHLALADPRNGSNRSLATPGWHETNAQGLGIMYRLIDLPELVRALAGVRFGRLTARVKLRLTDPLLTHAATPGILAFADGMLALANGGEADAELHVESADLASLLMGSVRLSSLARYGCARLRAPELLAPLDAAFATDPPQCKTRF